MRGSDPTQGNGKRRGEEEVGTGRPGDSNETTGESRAGAPYGWDKVDL